MKLLGCILLALIMLSGCSYKNEALSLDSYKAEYQGPHSKENKTIYLRSVKDLRAKKNVVGYLDQKTPNTCPKP